VTRTIDYVLVLDPSADFQRAKYLSTAVAAEFPPVMIELARDQARDVHLSASDWYRSDFDFRAFDERIDSSVTEAFTLVLRNDANQLTFPLEVLTRCQNFVARRNARSTHPLFDRVLCGHAYLFERSTRRSTEDYKHSLDTWQWILRLEPSASLELQLAALFHGIKRLLANNEDAHVSSAAIAAGVISSAGASHAVCDRVAHLIRNLEKPLPDPELALLCEADALSFFSLESPGFADDFGPQETRKAVAYMWDRLRPAARSKLGYVRMRDDVEQMLRDVSAA